MAVSTIDNLGRKIDQTNMSLGELKSLVETLAKSPVGPARPYGKASKKTTDQISIEKIRKLLEENTQSFTKDSKDQQKLLEQIVDELKSMDSKRETKRKASNAGGGGGGGGKKRKTGYGDDDDYKRRKFNDTGLQKASRNLNNIFPQGLGVIDKAFKGAIKDEMSVVQNMRAIAYETTGATKEAELLMKSFEDIGKSSKETGVDREIYLKAYATAIKGGIRDLKIASSITKSQLNTESQLGIEADSLGETFREWNQSGRMTTNQISEMGRGLRDVAKFTGLTGNALRGVVESSKEFIKDLTRSATLTSATAKNIIEIGANAKKLGIESEIQPFVKGMANASHLLLEAGSQVQSFLYAAAGSVKRISDLSNGTILRSKDGIKDMANGIKNVLKQFGIQSVEAIDQMSDAAKRDINLSLKASFGIELGTARSLLESLTEAGKGYADRLADINKKMGQNITTEERAALMEQKRALKASTSLSVLTALDEAAKGAKDMNQALAKFGTRRKEFEADVQALGQTWTSEADVARSAIQNALDGINSGLKKAGKKEIKIDSSEIENAIKDPTILRELTSKITKGEQELSTAQKKQLDPLNSMQQSLMEINDNIRNFTNRGISSLFNSLIGKVAVLGLTLGGGISGVVGKLAGLQKLLMNAKDWLFKKDDQNRGSALASATTNITDSKKFQTTEVVNQKTDKKLLRNDVKSQKTGDNLQKQQAAILDGQQQNIKKQSVATVPSPPEDNKLDPKAMASTGKNMTQSAAGMMVLAAGVFALGTAIVFLSHKILSALHLDLKTVIETAEVVGAIALAGGAIAAAGAGAFVVLNSGPVKNFTENAAKSAPNVLKTAAAMLIIGPAFVLLGAAVIGMTNAILGKLDLDTKKIIQMSEVIAAVAGATGAVAYGISYFVETMKNLDSKPEWMQIKLDPGKLAKNIALGAAAILLLGPAIVLLGAAVIKMSQMILGVFNLDSKVAAKVGYDVAAIIGAAGLIALAVIGASAGLAALGFLVYSLATATEGIGLLGIIGLMAVGAEALLLMAPAIVLLGSAVISICRGIMGIAGLDARVAATAAKDVAAIIVSASLIAASVLAAGGALAILGLFVTSPAFLIGSRLAVIGALGLMAMTPSILLLASAVLYMSEKIMKYVVNPKKAEETSKAFGSIIESAAKIASSVVLAGASLALLGFAITSPIGLVAAGLAGAGALFLLALTPAIGLLASAVIYMAKKVMNETVSARVAERTTKSFASVIESASKIASAVVDATGDLAILGLVVATGLFPVVAGLAFAGGLAILKMIPSVGLLARSVIKLAKASMQGMNPKKTEETTKSFSAIVESAAKISKAVIISQAYLAALGLVVRTGIFDFIRGFAIIGAKELETLTPDIVNLANSVIGIVNSPAIGKKINSARAADTAKRLGIVISAAGDIIKSVVLSGAALAGAGLLGSTGLLEPVIAAALTGSRLLERYKPIAGEVVKSIVGITEEVSKTSGISGRTIRVAKQLSVLLKTFSEMINVVTSFAPSIGDVLSQTAGSVIDSGLNGAKKTFSGIKDGLFGGKGIFGVISDAINPKNTNETNQLAENTQKAQGPLQKLGEQLKDYISVMLDASKSALEQVGGPGGIKGALQGMFLIVRSVKNFSKVMELLSNVAPLAEDVKIDFGSGFGNTFKNIIGFVKNDILKPMEAFPASKDLEDSINQLSAMVRILNRFNAVLMAMGRMMDLISESTINFGALDQIPVKKIADFATDLNKVNVAALGNVNGRNTIRPSIQAANPAALGESLAGSLNSGKITNGTSRNVGSVAPVPLSSPLTGDLHTAVAADHASSYPDKTEVTSPELGKIANESMDQSAKLDMLIKLFTEVVTALKPKSSPISSSGGGSGNSQANQAILPPPNYMKTPYASVAKQSGKAMLNMGVIS